MKGHSSRQAAPAATTAMDGRDTGHTEPVVDTPVRSGAVDGSDAAGPRTPAATLRARDTFAPAGVPLIGVDGSPLTTADGNAFVAPFTRPVLDAEGKPVLGGSGAPAVTPTSLPITDEHGHPVLDAAGAPLSGLVAKRTRRDQDPKIRRAWVTLLTARALTILPLGQRTIAQFEKWSLVVATLVGDPSAAFRRQDADRSVLVGGIYRRAQFGRTRRTGSSANASAAANWAAKFRTERKQRIEAEERAKTLERTVAGARLISAVELVMAAEVKWGLTPNGKAAPRKA